MWTLTKSLSVEESGSCWASSSATLGSVEGKVPMGIATEDGVSNDLSEESFLEKVSAKLPSTSMSEAEAGLLNGAASKKLNTENFGRDFFVWVERPLLLKSQ